MPEPLRLGLSGSSFTYAMPRDLLMAAYRIGQTGKIQKFDSDQNRRMAAFMRDIMRVMNTTEIACMECYHSLGWDRDLILDVLLDEADVEFWAVHAPYGRYADPSSPDEEARRGALQGCRDSVHVAARLGAGVVVAHPGVNIAYDVPRQARIEFSIQTLREVADFAAERGVSVGVEPMPKDEIGNSLDELLLIIERVDRPNVGVNFDVNHLFPPQAIPNMIRSVGERMLSVHVSDQDGAERHWLPLTGDLNWREILAALVEIGYQGPLVYETHLTEAESCEDVGRIVVENYDRLMSLLPDVEEARS